MINPSHFGCTNSTMLTGLRQMYIDSSCPNLGICIKISNGSIDSPITDPNEGCFLVKFTFLLQLHLKLGTNWEKTPKNLFMCFLWWHIRKSCVEVWRGKRSGCNLRDNPVSVPRLRKKAAHRPKHKVFVCGTSSARIHKSYEWVIESNRMKSV